MSKFEDFFVDATYNKYELKGRDNVYTVMSALEELGYSVELECGELYVVKDKFNKTYNRLALFVTDNNSGIPNDYCKGQFDITYLKELSLGKYEKINKGRDLTLKQVIDVVEKFNNVSIVEIDIDIFNTDVDVVKFSSKYIKDGAKYILDVNMDMCIVVSEFGKDVSIGKPMYTFSSVREYLKYVYDYDYRYGINSALLNRI